MTRIDIDDETGEEIVYCAVCESTQIDADETYCVGCGPDWDENWSERQSPQSTLLTGRH